MITSVINVLTTLIAIALIDKIGRKPLLLIGSSGMAVTLITMAVIFANATLNADGTPSLPGASGLIALIAANLFVVAFGMSWGPVVWVLLGRDVPQPHPRRRARPGRGGAVGGQLADHRHRSPACATISAWRTASTGCARCCRASSCGGG